MKPHDHGKLTEEMRGNKKIAVVIFPDGSQMKYCGEKRGDRRCFRTPDHSEKIRDWGNRCVDIFGFIDEPVKLKKGDQG